MSSGWGSGDLGLGLAYGTEPVQLLSGPQSLLQIMYHPGLGTDEGPSISRLWCSFKATQTQSFLGGFWTRIFFIGT